MRLSLWSRKMFTFVVLVMLSYASFANDALFRHARDHQRNGKYDEAIGAFQSYLAQPVDDDAMTDEVQALYIEALLQMMNTFQSKGAPDSCIIAMNRVYDASPVLQKYCQRDYYSILGYALSRTEDMQAAEETMLKALTMPLYHPTPQRYFRDYAYAAAVFYSNPDYLEEVINWCEEAMLQAEQCKNTSGKQWVSAMLGSLYKRNGRLNDALVLFQQSREESIQRNDTLGVLNTLHALIDLFLYWDIPEYANVYASEAVLVEQSMKAENPMVSAQTYINKGRALYQMGEADSSFFYVGKARQKCQSLPYNSGMVDVNLLHGALLTEQGGDHIYIGIEELELVTKQATAINRAKAYHQLAQTYLKINESAKAEVMLDSMYMLLNQNATPTFIHIDYQPILHHYLGKKNHSKAEQYLTMMLQEQQSFKEKKLNYNLVENIVELQTEKKRQELQIMHLTYTNQRLWLLVGIVMAFVSIFVIVVSFVKQRRRYQARIKRADERLSALLEKLRKSSAEKEIRKEEIKEFLEIKENRDELENITPMLLPTEGERKFRQCFELLYPMFLPHLRERVPSITRREELFCMLVVLRQDNKKIAELMGIVPRSVLMLRHRLRQKIGLAIESSLDIFIEGIIAMEDEVIIAPESEVPEQSEDEAPQE